MAWTTTNALSARWASNRRWMRSRKSACRRICISAEAGRASGGIINILTKSGSNQVHGTAYEFVRNDRFDSRDFFARVDPILKQHQFGGSLGGPLVANRTFFFADYEGLRNTKGQVNNLTLPTLKMRQGDFSELLPTQIFDPTSAARVAFPGNIIPRERLNPVALQYMALLPEPTNAGLANNAQTTTIGWQRQSHRRRPRRPSIQRRKFDVRALFI